MFAKPSFPAPSELPPEMEDPTSSYSPPQEPVSFTGQRMLAAIVFTDTVGFSVLAKENEEHALKCVARDLDRMKVLCDSFGGQTIKGTGDGLLMMFVSAVQAVSCSLEIQRDIHQNNLSLPTTDRLQHRIGIHLGDVFLNGTDVLGDGVNIAARLQGAARPGGVCVSHTVFDVVNNRVKFHINELGEQKLKNIGKVKAYQISPLEGGINSPGSNRFVKRPWEVYYGLLLGLGVLGVMVLAVFTWKSHKGVSDKPAATLTPFVDDMTTTPASTTPVQTVETTPSPAPVKAEVTSAPLVTPVSVTMTSPVPEISSGSGIGTAGGLNRPENPTSQTPAQIQGPGNEDFDMGDPQIATLLQKKADYFQKYDFHGFLQWMSANPGTGDAVYQLREKMLSTKVTFLADLFGWWTQTFKTRYSSLSPLVIYGKDGYRFTMYPDVKGQPLCQEGQGAIPGPCPFDQISPKVMVALIQKTLEEQFRFETPERKRYRDELIGFCLAYHVTPPKPPERRGFLQSWFDNKKS